MNRSATTGEKLPHGRHGIPRAAVVANQRGRILEAAADCLAERGYADLRVSEITARAGVSRATFYELFSDKRACVLAAQDAAYERVNDEIRASCASRSDWADRVAAAIGAALEFAARSPESARLVLPAHHIASDPGLAKHGRVAQMKLADAFRSGRGDPPGAGDVFALTDQALVGALMSVVGSRLSAGEAESLLELKPHLVRMILTPYVGAAEAQRVASTA